MLEDGCTAALMIALQNMLGLLSSKGLLSSSEIMSVLDASLNDLDSLALSAARTRRRRQDHRRPLPAEAATLKQP